MTSFIENKRNDATRHGLIIGGTKLTFESCNLLKNEGDPLFSMDSYYDSTSLILKSCFFDSEAAIDCELHIEDRLNAQTDISITYFTTKVCEDKFYHEKTLMIIEPFKICYIPSLYI